MFRPARMVHVEILLSQNSLLLVSEFLGQMGTLHLTQSSRRSGAAPAASRQDAQAVEVYRDLSNRLRTLCTFFDISVDGDRPLRREATHISRDAEKIASELERLEYEAEDIEAALALLTEENARMETLREQIEPLAFLHADLTMLHEFRHMTKALGTVPTDILPRLRKGLSGYNVMILPVRVIGERTVLMAFAASTHEEVLRYALRSAFFKEIVIPPNLKGTPRKILQTIDVITGENQEGIDVLTEERAELAERRKDRLLELWYQTEDNRRTFEMIGLFLKTREAYLITGWLPANELSEVERAVEELTDGRALVTATKPRPNDQSVPTCLENPPLLSSFELLTETYGVPAYDERDPTLFLALSAIIMFGAMFADVGHGLTLALFGVVLASWFGRSERMLRHLGIVICSFGISASIFGVLFGSVFGKETIFQPLWLSPMHAILPLFSASCAFGAGLVILGLLLNIYNLVIRQEYVKACCDKFGLAGILFYGACLSTALTCIEGGFAVLSWFHGLFLTLPLCVIALEKPLVHRWGKKSAVTRQQLPLSTMLINGAVEVLETCLTYFSNTLSFVRIGAFALCHAGLSQSVYVIAEDVAGGGLIGWGFIVAGNLFIVLFEGLIVSIQTMRLEYYEFFSKFFRSGGKRYRPFALERRRTRS